MIQYPKYHLKEGIQWAAVANPKKKKKRNLAAVKKRKINVRRKNRGKI